MPTISEPIDPGMRAGKAQSVLEWYQRGVIGEATTEASLRILRYESEEIRLMLHQWKPV